MLLFTANITAQFLFITFPLLKCSVYIENINRIFIGHPRLCRGDIAQVRTAPMPGNLLKVS